MSAPAMPFTVIDGGAPPPEPKKRFLRTDLGNAERFVARCGRDVRYIAPWKKWLVWTGKVWAIDEILHVQRLAKQTVRAMWDEVKETDGDTAKGDMVRHAMHSEKASAIRAMLERVQAEPGIAITPAQLDADPWLLAVENGVLDLRTGELRPHERSHLMTKIVPAAYDENATCPTWEKFLRRTVNNDADLLAFLQRAVGYSLTGTTGERKLFFLYGSGANGKSTFLEIVRALLAEYSKQADFTTFLERKGDGPRNDIARLFGARVVTSSEVGEGKRLNESLVKTLTGNDVVTARFLHAENFEFAPQFKLWLAANHRPVIRGTDNAIWERVRLVPFTVAIPEHERDPDLKAKLMEELPGILAWAVQGCLLWLESGLGNAARVAEATAAYRRESDTLGHFLEECAEVDTNNPEWATRATDLYYAYKRWADEGGEFQLSQTAFGRQLEERGIHAVKRGRDAGRVKWRVGLRLTVDVIAPRKHHAPPAAGSQDEEEGLF